MRLDELTLDVYWKDISRLSGLKFLIDDMLSYFNKL